MAYPAPVAHIWICDVSDPMSQAVCAKVQVDFPAADITIIVVETPGAAVASKIRKLQAALPYVTGAVIGFMDDDVAPRRDTLRQLIPHLTMSRAGAVFGLGCHASPTGGIRGPACSQASSTRTCR
jgi:cellulose synthase/poly-beta-1,6-N-acetylglucosamine synthase-like glycosyltransferase